MIPIPQRLLSLLSNGSFILIALLGWAVCTRDVDTIGAGQSTGLAVRLDIGSALAGNDSTAIDTIVISVFSDDSSTLVVSRAPYRAHRVTFPRIGCEIPVTVRIEALDSDGMPLFWGKTRIPSVTCGQMSVTIDQTMITPFRPSRLKIDSIGSGFVGFTWQHPSPDTTLLFDIWRSTDSTFIFLDSSNLRSFVDTALTPLQSCIYRIRARNNVGASGWLYSPVVQTTDLDSVPPTFTLVSHALDDTVNTERVRLFGTVSDLSGVASLKLDSVDVGIDDGFWVIDSVQLPDPENRFTFTASDSSIPPNTLQIPFRVFRTSKSVETRPPAIALLAPSPGDTVRNSLVSMIGAADDESGIDSVYVNGHLATLEGLSWKVDSIVLQPGPNTITVEAVDKSVSANRSSKVYEITYVEPCSEVSRPSLRIVSHSRVDTVAQRLVRLVGSAQSDIGIAWVSVGDDTVAVESGIWDRGGVLLDSGYNEVPIVARDSCGETNDSMLTWNVWYIPTYEEPANRAPIFTVSSSNLSDTIKAGQTHSRVLSAVDPDTLNILTFSVDSPLTLSSDSMAIWETESSDTGVHTVTASVQDQDGLSDTVSWQLTVLDPSVNFMPVFVSSRDSLLDSIITGQVYIDTVRAEDPDGDSVVFRFDGPSPSGLQLDSVSGALRWEPDSTQRGKHSILVTIDDGRGGSARLLLDITVWDPDLPVVNAGSNVAVSPMDSVHLRGSVSSSVSSISRTEWDIGGGGVFVESGVDTTFVLPGNLVSDSTLICILRAWDTELRTNVDTALIQIRRDPPKADAGRDTVVRAGESFSLHGSGSDRYGTVVSFAWDIGATGAFAASPDGSISGRAPATTGPYYCVLRVTDDDNVDGFDTAIVHVANPGMVRIIGSAENMVEERYIRAFQGNENGDDDEKPLHEVWLSPFWIDSVEVTVEEYVELMGVDPTLGAAPSVPVQNVTWFDAVLFCNARSKASGMDTVYRYTGVSGTAGNGCTGLSGLTVMYDNVGYRLPTEAEWEFACRGNTVERTEYYWSDEPTIAGTFAWYSLNASESAHAVALKPPNGFGLYDMAGNVAEWCNDWYSSGYYAECDTGIVINPRGPQSGSTRLNRGGSYESPATELRSSSRGLGIPNWRAGFVGFRTVVPSQ